MKKLLALFLALAMVLAFAACNGGGKKPGPDGDGETKEVVAFCSDVGSIDDESFNQFCYAGVKAIADKNGLADPQYYIPSEDNNEQDRDHRDPPPGLSAGKPCQAYGQDPGSSGCVLPLPCRRGNAA